MSKNIEGSNIIDARVFFYDKSFETRLSRELDSDDNAQREVDRMKQAYEEIILPRARERFARKVASLEPRPSNIIPFRPRSI